MAPRTVGRRKITLTINALTAVPISSTDLYTPDFIIYFPNGNTGATAYIGNSSVDNTWIPRAKNLPLNFVSGTGSMGGTIPEVAFNLKNIYVLGSNIGDTAIIEYMYYDR